MSEELDPLIKVRVRGLKRITRPSEEDPLRRVEGVMLVIEHEGRVGKVIPVSRVAEAALNKHLYKDEQGQVWLELRRSMAEEAVTRACFVSGEW